MGIRYSRFIGLIHLIGDLTVLNLAFLLGHYFLYGQIAQSEAYTSTSVWIFFNVCWVGVIFAIRIYEIARVALWRDIFSNIIKVFLLHVALMTTFVVLFHELSYSTEQLLSTYLIGLGLVLTWRFSFITFLRYYRSIGFNYRKIIIVGYDNVAKELFAYFNSNPSFGYRFYGFFANSNKNKRSKDIKGTIEDIEEYVKQNEIDEIYCSIANLKQEHLNKLVQIADNNLIRLKLLPDYQEMMYDKVLVSHYGRLPVITFRNEPLNNYINGLLKRSFDILFSLAVILFVVSWLFPLIALLIKVNSPGPVFFFQKRTGKYNKTFWCWKFRTMHLNGEADIRQATADDERITSIGCFLRRSNLDELPQFFNVLLGEMSVVGPRPHPLVMTEHYPKVINNYMVRHYVKPGITGLSQTRGLRGETKTVGIMRNRVRMDIFYIENWSFILDLKIIFLTIINMIRGDKHAV